MLFRSQEHLGPVGRLGPAGAGAYRQDRRAIIVLAGEEERGALAVEIGLEGDRIAVELGLEVRIRGVVEELDDREQVVGAGQEVTPRVQLGPEVVGLAQDLLGTALVVPEPWFLGQRLELGDALCLGLEVKDAPRSIGSVRPGRGRRTRPPSSGPADPGAGSAAAR